MTQRLLSVLLSVLAPTLALAEEAPKVAVVPFAPLSGDVPNNAGSKAAEVFLTALKGHENLSAQDASASAAEDPAAHLKKANEGLLAARKQLDAGQPQAAKAALEAVLTEFTAGAAALDDLDALADAYAALSRARYQTGDDEGGLKALDEAEALRPGRDFLEARSSPLFASLAAKEKDRVLAAAKSSVQINSVPPGASARIDGLDAGRTPVLVKDLPPGPHAWKVELPSGASVGGVVETQAGQKATVVGAAAGSGPAAALVSQVAGNALGPDALAAMKNAASGLDVAYVVFGGLHAEGSDLVLDSFVYSTKGNAFARLPQAKFDADLVSAGQSLSAVANDVAGRVVAGTLGMAAKVPAKISDSVSAGEASELSEFRFPAPGSEAAVKVETGPRKVVGARHGPVTK
jgi:hypothetical protein